MHHSKVIKQLNIAINKFKEIHRIQGKWDTEINEHHYDDLVAVRKLIEQL